MPLPRNCLDNSQLAPIVSELSRQFSFCLDGFGIAAAIPVRRSSGQALPCKLAKADAKAKRLALATDAFGRALANAGERGYLYFQTHLDPLNQLNLFNLLNIFNNFSYLPNS